MANGITPSALLRKTESVRLISGQLLSTRGFTVQTNAALAFTINSEKLVYLPAGDTAGIVAETYLGQWYAVGLVKEGDKTVNIRPDRGVHHITGFDPKTRGKLLKSLRSNPQIKSLEKTLNKQGQLLDWSHSVLIVDTENNQATVGLAVKAVKSTNPAWFGYHVDATLLKGNKLSVQNIKAETCGTLATAAPIAVQSSGETKPQFYDGEPTPGGTLDPTQVCVSSWGYNYYCFNSTPQFGVSAVSSALIAFVGSSVQAQFTIWNYSSQAMSGTATSAAPFSIVSGGSYSLQPGQPQTVVVQFSPTALWNSGGSVTLTSGSLVQTVVLSAWTLTVTPARLDYTTFVGGSQNQTFYVKNDGPGPVYNDLLNRPPTPGASSSVTLSTTAPYSINPASFTVIGQNSTQVTIGYAPTTAGSFPGSVHLVSGQSSMDLPVGGSTYQVSLNPAQPNVSAFVGGSGQQKVTLINTSTIPVTLTPSMTAPFSIVSPTGAITLAANQSVDLTLQFSPTAAGTFTGNLHLVSSASASKDFVIAGTTQALSISSAELVFPGTFVNSSPQQTMTVTNTGLASISLNASAVAPFGVVSPTGTVSLAPNQGVNLVVQFKPTAAGTYAGNVTLTSGSFVQNVAVTGWTFSLSAAQLDYTTFIGNPAPEQTIVVNNDGPAPDSLDAINLGKRGTTTAKLIGQAATFNVNIITPLTATGTPAFSVSPFVCHLYGQQYCQLKVKFIPTESGVFAGNINLTSANGGITSNLNLGVTGTAHKVSIDPVQPYFAGLAGSTLEQKLKVKNVGFATVTFTASTSAPFSVVSPIDSFTLAPTETQELVVKFSPTQSGRSSGTVRLNNGASAIEVPIVGDAFTIEEYLAVIAQLLSLSQQTNGNPPGLYLPNARLIVYGFQNLSSDELGDFIRHAQYLQSLPQEPVIPADLPPLTQEITLAVQALSPYLNSPDFDQRLTEVLQQYPRFASLVRDWAQVNNQSEHDIAQQIITLFLQQPDADDLLKRYDQLKEKLIQLGIIAVGTDFSLLNCCNAEWRWFWLNTFASTMVIDPGFVGLSRADALFIFGKFLDIIQNFLDGHNVYGTTTKEELLRGLLNALPSAQLSQLLQPNREQILAYVRLVQLLGHMIFNASGWQFIEFNQLVGCAQCPDQTHIHVVATKNIPSLGGNVTVFVKAYDQASPEDIAKDLSKIVDHVEKNANNFPGRDIVVAFRGGQTSDDQAQAILDKLQKDKPDSKVPVVVIYCTGGCNGPNPAYKIKHNQNISDPEARRLACEMGFMQFCPTLDPDTTFVSPPLPFDPLLVGNIGDGSSAGHCSFYICHASELNAVEYTDSYKR